MTILIRNMSRYKPCLNFAAGAVLGYVVVHPMVMMTSDLMVASVSHANNWTVGDLKATVQGAFHLAMLPWGLGFGLLCAIVGWLLAKSREASLREQKLQGVMELAGAACHELNQPMQVVLGYSELLKNGIPPDDPTGGNLHEIIVHIEKMDRILKKIRAITRYEAMEYIEGIQIIDIDKSSQR